MSSRPRSCSARAPAPSADICELACSAVRVASWRAMASRILLPKLAHRIMSLLAGHLVVQLVGLAIAAGLALTAYAVTVCRHHQVAWYQSTPSRLPPAPAGATRGLHGRTKAGLRPRRGTATRVEGYCARSRGFPPGRDRGHRRSRLGAGRSRGSPSQLRHQLRSPPARPRAQRAFRRESGG